jgi:hypothetical protein
MKGWKNYLFFYVCVKNIILGYNTISGVLILFNG